MATKSSIDFVPVHLPLGMIEDVNEDQIERLRVLADRDDVHSIDVMRDLWMDGAILFTLRDHLRDPILHGLIEPDGCAHT